MTRSLPMCISTTELMDVLRSSLSVLVPVVERVGMPWTEGDAYDDWDTIASTLYEQIVVATIRESEEVPGDVLLPDYDLCYESYRGMAFLELVSVETDEQLGVFIGFDASERGFSNAKYTALFSEDTASSDGASESVAFRECTVRLRLTGARGRTLERLTIG